MLFVNGARYIQSDMRERLERARHGDLQRVATDCRGKLRLTMAHSFRERPLEKRDQLK